MTLIVIIIGILLLPAILKFGIILLWNVFKLIISSLWWLFVLGFGLYVIFNLLLVL